MFIFVTHMIRVQCTDGRGMVRVAKMTEGELSVIPFEQRKINKTSLIKILLHLIN